jgi:hypothetical protein
MTYEKSDLPAMGLVAFVAGVAILVVLTLAVTIPLLSQSRAFDAKSRGPEHPLADQNIMPPEPRLQTAPAKELSAHDAKVKSELETYGWIDRPAGRVRLPINRAMELVLKEGLEVRK